MEEFVKKLVSQVWNGQDVSVTAEEYGAIPSSVIAEEGIVVLDHGNGTYTLSRHNYTPVAPKGHQYVLPPFTPRVKALLKKAVNGVRACNILLYGPMGTGKTEFVEEMCKQCGFSRVFHINGVEEMGEDAFYGHLTCKVDKSSGQNYTPFEKGPLYRAFIEGTEVDQNGDQILYDENGNVTTSPDGKPKIVGKPAIFFLDEFATVRSEVFLGVFNRALEIPRDGGSRSIEISAENGKTVKSHPGLVLVFAGNTAGCGNGGRYQTGYTAQSNQMDKSTLNRLSGKYEFGYSLPAEENIARGMLNDDLEADKLISLAKSIREQYLTENVETIFSTRSLKEVCETATAYRDAGEKRWMVDAIMDTIFNGLPENDRNAFNEIIRALWGVDLVQEFSESRKKDYFYV